MVILKRTVELSWLSGSLSEPLPGCVLPWIRRLSLGEDNQLMFDNLLWSL